MSKIDANETLHIMGQIKTRYKLSNKLFDNQRMNIISKYSNLYYG